MTTCRVTYTIDGDDITFSDPIAVEIFYQDKSDGKVAASATPAKAAAVFETYEKFDFNFTRGVEQTLVKDVAVRVLRLFGRAAAK